MLRNDIRNVAIIAHVDHGKTTLVDQMLRQSGTFRVNQHVRERVMDSNDLERERGITILAKNTSVYYKDTKINIVDTPGHTDFGGEVERILSMVDGVLLLVDAFEGVMPQTRFVLQKALGMEKHVVVVLNKMDRQEARPDEVVDSILELFIELGANDSQLDFNIVYASARDGYASLSPDEPGTDIQPLFDAIIEHIPAPEGDADAPLQVMFSNIDYDDYVGRLGVGRIQRGKVKNAQQVLICRLHEQPRSAKVGQLYTFEGLGRKEAESASYGDIIAVAGIAELNIGDTACAPECPEPLEFVNIDEPTLSMMFIVNNSPFAGEEGKYVTSRNLRQRLLKEVETNVSMRVEETDSPDMFKVSGRGELHLSILIEQMRREDYEFSVSRPEVIYREEGGKRLEPMERLTIKTPEEYVGQIMEKLGPRKAELLDMRPDNGGMKLEFSIPARGLMGYRSELLTDTRGNGIMHHLYDGYAPYKGDMPARTRGSIVAHEAGISTAYAIFNCQSRGRVFIEPGVKVYEGMIVGENAKAEDLVYNICRKKHMTNIRASGSDDSLKLVPAALLSLEQCIEFIAEDELIEVTPKSIRMRKATLNKEMRNKAQKKV